MDLRGGSRQPITYSMLALHPALLWRALPKEIPHRASRPLNSQRERRDERSFRLLLRAGQLKEMLRTIDHRFLVHRITAIAKLHERGMPAPFSGQLAPLPHPLLLPLKAIKLPGNCVD